MNSSPEISSVARTKAATRLCGLLTRRHLWIPSWKGWLLILLFFVGSCYGLFRASYPFLAANDPESSEYLVVEGWVPDYALKDALDLSVRTHCRFLIIAGGPVRGGVDLEPEDTYARIGLARLRALGGNVDRVRAVDSPDVTRDRTYSSAVAVRKWFTEQGIKPQSLNVLTLGPHSRRSWLLFQKAFGDDVRVGVVSVPDREYDGRVWWRSSEGLREVLSEGLAYLYARFVFRPE